MEKGELLFIYPRACKSKCGTVKAFQSQYLGNEDLSYHGSPFYEEFIICSDTKTGEIQHYGSQEYAWCNAEGYITNLQNSLKNIKKISWW